MITIKEEKIAEMMFDIWHESNKLKNPVMVGEYIANKLKEVINFTHCCKSDSELLLAYTEFLRKELHLNISDTWIESYKKNSK
jgi:hypothetical protein